MKLFMTLFFSIVFLNITNGASITANWTAVGDDNYVGTASEYDGRVSTSIDSLTNNWDDCYQWIGSSVSPSPSGQSESYDFEYPIETGINYYFAIKAADEIPNWSNISNIDTVFYVDSIPPATIIDLEIQ